MKKFLTIILALALVMSLSVPVFATNPTSGQTDLSFIYVNEPVYTVAIPPALALELGNNYLPITVSDVQYLGDKTITVTFEGTQRRSNPGNEPARYYLQLSYQNISNSFLYDLFDSMDIEAEGFFVTVQQGRWLADFQSNGTKTIRLFIDPDVINGSILTPNVPYTGYIIFGIKLV